MYETDGNDIKDRFDSFLGFYVDLGGQRRAIDNSSGASISA